MTSINTEVRLETAQEYLGQFDVAPEAVDIAQRLQTEYELLVQSQRSARTRKDAANEENVRSQLEWEVNNGAELAELVLEGLITFVEAKIIGANLPKVWHILNAKEAKGMLDSNLSFNMFADYYDLYILGKTTDNKATRIDTGVREFFKVLEAIAERGKYLVIGTELETTVLLENTSRKKRIAQFELAHNTSPDQLAVVIDEKRKCRDLSLHRVLMAIDAFTFASVLPDDLGDIQLLVDINATANLPLVLIAAMSESSLSGALSFDVIAESLIERGVELGFEGAEAEDEMFRYITALDKMGLLSGIVNEEHAAATKLNHYRGKITQQDIKSTEAERNQHMAIVEALFSALLGCASEYAGADQTRDRVLGALAIENILDSFIHDAVQVNGFQMKKKKR